MSLNFETVPWRPDSIPHENGHIKYNQSDLRALPTLIYFTLAPTKTKMWTFIKLDFYFQISIIFKFAWRPTSSFKYSKIELFSKLWIITVTIVIILHDHLHDCGEGCTSQIPQGGWQDTPTQM